MWKIKYLKSLKKSFNNLDSQTKEKIIDFLENKIANMENPRQFGKALKGNFSELWRYRLGNYRIVCEIQDNALVILVVRLGHRKVIYKKK
jgi:mRNA interferase RelE/StbE